MEFHIMVDIVETRKKLNNLQLGRLLSLFWVSFFSIIIKKSSLNYLHFVCSKLSTKTEKE